MILPTYNSYEIEIPDKSLSKVYNGQDMMQMECTVQL